MLAESLFIVLLAAKVFSQNEELGGDLLPYFIPTEEVDSTTVPVFLEEPSDTFVLRNKPGTLRCSAIYADGIYFVCNKQRMKDKQVIQTNVTDPEIGVYRLTSTLEVTRYDVESFFSESGYRCECYAWSGARKVKTKRAKVVVAYLRKHFLEHPYSQNVEFGKQVEMRCLPPEGVPHPTVKWYKNQVQINPYEDPNFIITSEGNLLIVQARLMDGGNYTCSSENIANKRISDTAVLSVHVDGQWSVWSSWSPCKSTKCGKGYQVRYRTCSNPAPLNGGVVCPDSNVQTVDCTIPCPAINGGWSKWSVWSTCGPDCRYTRKRSCTNPKPEYGGDFCVGSYIETANCTEGYCRENSNPELSYDTAATETAVKSDLALYIGLGVAVVVFAVVFILLLNSLRQKDRDQSIYGLPQVLDECDRPYCGNSSKSIGLPDITKNVMELPCNNMPLEDYTFHQCKVWPTDHHYEVPHMSLSPSYSVPLKPQDPDTDADGSDSTEYSSASLCPQGEQDLARQSAASSITPPGVDSKRVAWIIVSRTGSHVTLPESGVFMTIPEGAVKRRHKEEMFLSVQHPRPGSASLKLTQTLLTPVVGYGPPTVTLAKPVVLSCGHCADLSLGDWRISVCYRDNEQSPWTTVVTLGLETINTPLYVQLDPGMAHLVCEQPGQYCLVGESGERGPATKNMKLAVFRSSASSGPKEVIRVYCVDDTRDPLEPIKAREAKMNGIMVDKPKSISVTDGGPNLIVVAKEISPGWVAKTTADYQEIPFKRLWANQTDSPHCILVFRRVSDSSGGLSCKLEVYQEGFLDRKLQVSVDHPDNRQHQGHMSDTSCFVKGSTITFSSGYSSGATVDKLPPFKLTRKVRQGLIQLLDPPNMQGNDWRMLAQYSKVDRYINYFATKPSPTDQILDLWEARHRDLVGVGDLMNILRQMGRLDALKILEKHKPPWI